MVAWRKGGKKTLGMEACGIEFSDVPEGGGNWAAAASILASAASQWYLSQGAQTPRRMSEDAAGGRSSRRRDHVLQRPSSELLRGDQRRQYYEDQRRAMMDRSSGATKRRGEPSRQESGRLCSHLPKQPEAGFLSRLLHLARQLAASVSSAANDDYGPHALWNEAATSSLASPPRVQALTIGAWIVRLHLAFYCLGGRYPSWLHRLFRLSLARSRDALVHRPSSTPALVGVLIVAQAVGASVPAVTRALLRCLDRRGVLGLATAAAPRAEPSVTFVSHPKDLTRRRMKPAAPLAEASSGRSRRHWPASSSPSSPSASASSSERTCMICRQARQHPSCPPCGHVFCWTCLQQWLSHRQSCPYCRTSCRPQDVLALHKY